MPISGYRDFKKGIIDMKDAINNQIIPDFGIQEPPMRFDEAQPGWNAMLALIN